MFTPYRELVIVHAVRQPLTPPVIAQAHRRRSPGATYALLIGDALAQVQSTIRVDVLAAWADPYDDGKSKQGAVLLDKTSRVDEIPLTLGQSDLLPLDKIRHDFGDTKHHEVFYHAVATTRFLEYFTEVVTENLTGTARGRLLDGRLRARHGRGSRGRRHRDDLPLRRRLHRGRQGRLDRSHPGWVDPRRRVGRRCSSWPLP